MQALLNELEMMSALQHPNVVSFVEYFLQDDPAQPHAGACIIVMELLEGPDMMDFIDEAGGFTRDDAKVRVTAWAPCVAVQRLRGPSYERDWRAMCRHLLHALAQLGDSRDGIADGARGHGTCSLACSCAV